MNCSADLFMQTPTQSESSAFSRTEAAALRQCQHNMHSGTVSLHRSPVFWQHLEAKTQLL